MNKNFYEILNIPQNSTLEEIKKAYRNLALKYHPDRNKDKDAHSKFIEINIAYETLKDVKSRNEYNSFLKSEKEQSEKGFGNYSNKEYEKKAREYANMSYEQFENLLENIFLVAKKVKKTTSMGFGWILTIIFYSLAGITFVGAFVGGNFSVIFISLILAFFGYGSYAMAKGE